MSSFRALGSRPCYREEADPSVSPGAPQGKAILPAMKTVRHFRSADGRDLYGLPVEAFPGFSVNLYLILAGSSVLLVDCGTGLESCRRQIEERFEEVRERFVPGLRISDVDLIVVTHGHIDHFGGLPWLKERTAAPATVHALDRRVLSHYEERVVVASKALKGFLELAGVSPQRQARLMEMYLFAKGRYRSTPVEAVLKEGFPELEGLDGTVEVIHVPGHCPGQVCLRFGDVLLTADHVLARTTPSQAPEAITQNMGLGHFFESLEKISGVEGIRLALGGHEDPMDDLYGRVREIRSLHEERLQKVVEICREPRTVAEISLELFGKRTSYHVLLALCEAGAHVEYLYQRGTLCATNVEEIERLPNPVILYQAC